ncbi:16S rRNA (uracil(1498)-N(3))-methyltransferase [Campylobacter pinnipediorum]|uniref:16S rRNA (uracil(1498)-N(3))-methyltransferase n=1 Tax=Campylobacter pinnipediorum TaxID=1965231 RepID=UPI001E572543|nr:16S rRNA (uracil(1498)-N(3))-methyltransferase [Campylobacter pinnipediorum]
MCFLLDCDMQFLYDKNAGNERLIVQNEPFLHLKARRVKVGDRIEVRNLKDSKRYLYEIENLERRSASLSLVFASLNEKPNYDFKIAWSVIDPKTIEKTLPYLNELGVGKIIFVYTDFSQANFKIDIKRFEYICALSCEQCGRDALMEFEIYDSIDDFSLRYNNVALIHFGGDDISLYKDELLFIGPEGGFSKREVELFAKKFGLKTKHILKSQTAITSVVSKILL